MTLGDSQRSGCSLAFRPYGPYYSHQEEVERSLTPLGVLGILSLGYRTAVQALGLGNKFLPLRTGDGPGMKDEHTAWRWTSHLLTIAAGLWARNSPLPFQGLPADLTIKLT